MKDIKIPFKLEGAVRIDDTHVHKAIREALANCIVNTDFYLPRGIVNYAGESRKYTYREKADVKRGDF